jgi:hypothetical protein
MTRREQLRREFEGIKYRNVFKKYVNDLFQKQDGDCFYCRKAMYEVLDGYTEPPIPEIPRMYYRYVVPNYTYDHKMPLARNGTNDFENIVLACAPCNSRKGVKTCDEYLAELSNPFY